MRVPTTDAFNRFLLDNGQTYPYSRLQATRGSFFCKWVMTKGYSVAGVTEYFPVLANSHSNAVLLEMIQNGEAKPLPPELSEIMDQMHWWGVHRSLHWYDEVVVMLDEAVDGEVEMEHRELVSVLVAPLVLEEIHFHFAVDSVAEHLLILEWMKWFRRTYKKGDTTPFRAMAEKSSDCIKFAISLVRNPPIVIDLTED
jgi:hypothetical protein